MNTQWQWQQSDQDAHDIRSYQPSDKQQAALIKAWQQSESFDSVIVEAQKSMNIKQGI